MKKSILALAALASVATVASAQSSVTLFGIVDAAARQVKNGSAGSQKQLASGANSTSRFGLRGVEDLGGGLRAGFHLESGIGIDTGTTDAKFWGRRSTVSLLGGFGEVRLGRDYLPSVLNTFLEPFGAVGVGSIGAGITYGAGSNLGSVATTVLRADNAVSFFLPPAGGLYGQGTVAAGEGVDGNKYKGARLGYGAGPVNVAVGYGVTDTGATPDFKQFNVTLNYDFGFAKLHTLYDVRKWSPREEKLILVGATVPLGGLGSLRFAYAKADRSGGAAGSGFGNADDATLIAAGYSYALSKRSTLYTTYSRIANKGARTSTVSSSGPLAGMRGGETSTGFEAGLSHSF